jgi:putative transposase
VKYAFIHSDLSAYDVTLCCQVLEVSRSGYYAWKDRPQSARASRREELSEKIVRAHLDNRQVYGSPRIHKALVKAGEQVCQNTVADIMREHGIRAKSKRKFVPVTTDCSHDQPVAGNLLDRQFTAALPNRKWVVDITYIFTDEGWLYLAGVMDLCSRKIVGWAMADHMKTDLVSDALTMALVQRQPPRNLLHHSDRGAQYASEDYRHLLARHGIEPSMSGKGNCWDNACCESFWATLKTEEVYLNHYATRQQARQAIFEYIEVFYNRKRLHSSLGYVSPEAFEAGLN